MARSGVRQINYIFPGFCSAPQLPHQLMQENPNFRSHRYILYSFIPSSYVRPSSATGVGWLVSLPACLSGMAWHHSPSVALSLLNSSAHWVRDICWSFVFGPYTFRNNKFSQFHSAICRGRRTSALHHTHTGYSSLSITGFANKYSTSLLNGNVMLWSNFSAIIAHIPGVNS